MERRCEARFGAVRHMEVCSVSRATMACRWVRGAEGARCDGADGQSFSARYTIPTCGVAIQ